MLGRVRVFAQRRLLSTTAVEGISSDLLVEASLTSAAGGRTNDELVESLLSAGMLTCRVAAAAMRDLDRKAFVNDHECPRPYANERHSLGHNASLSTPQMHAQLLSALTPSLGRGVGGRALDIGSGSGYLTAALAHAVGVGAPGGGLAVGIEHVGELAERARQNVAQANRGHWLEPGGAGDRGSCGQLLLEQGDAIAWLEGRGAWLRAAAAGGGEGGAGAGVMEEEELEEGPGWSVIHIGAAVAAGAEELLLAAAARSLAPGGRLLAPVAVDGGEQRLVAFDKGTEPGLGGYACIERSDLMAAVVEPLRPLGEQLEALGGTAADRAAVKAALDEWVGAFRADRGRAPSRDDMFAVPEAAALFTRFQELSKRSWTK
jgi:protein-L-isoaspartate(D-aspartate) O-methyltransferase